MSEGDNQRSMVTGGGDILTVQKNGVIAINSLAKLLQTISDNIAIITVNTGSNFPSNTSSTVAASTTQLIVAGSGRIFGVSIPVHAGSAQIFIYDSATTGGISATNLLYASIPSTSSGFLPYELLTITYSKGIVVKTEAGMNCCVTYTPNP